MRQGLWKSIFNLLVLLLIATVLLWGTGNLFAYLSYRQHTKDNLEIMRIIEDTRRPLASRLYYQQLLQNRISVQLTRSGAEKRWYHYINNEYSQLLLDELWPLYQQSNNQLIRDDAIKFLQHKLSRLFFLPQGTVLTTAEMNNAYNELKAYLMMATPDKVDPSFLSQTLLQSWQVREHISTPEWQKNAAGLINFYSQHLPQHPAWQAPIDHQFVEQVRWTLSQQILHQDNVESVYQRIRQQGSATYPPLALSQLIGTHNAELFFATAGQVPGLFTRQAWERSVRNEINQAVNKRSRLFDWVMRPADSTLDAEHSPELFKKQLTSRYFTEFSQQWILFLNSLQLHETHSLDEVIEQLALMSDAYNSPLIALSKVIVWQARTGANESGLGNALLPSMHNQLMTQNQQHTAVKNTMEQKPPLQGPLQHALEPLLSFITSRANENSVSLQSYLTRTTQIRLKLQQIANSADPQHSALIFGQNVLKGNISSFLDTADYSHLIAASLSDALGPFGHNLFIQPIRQAWTQVLAPTSEGLNELWRQSIVTDWNNTFTNRYPFADTKHNASLPLLGQFIRNNSGKIDLFLRNQLTNLLHKEGSKWFVRSLDSQEITINPQFLSAINQLSAVAEMLFASGDAGVRFELMAVPSADVVQTQLTLDGTSIKYFNQLENWHAFSWPGDTRHPAALLSWSSVRSNSKMLVQYEGSWATIRLLEMAQVSQLDSSRYQLTWMTPDRLKLTYILRSDIPKGPLNLLKLRNFRLPDTIFLVPDGAQQRTTTLKNAHSEITHAENAHAENTRAANKERSNG